MQWPDGSRYEGNWQNMKKHGKGVNTCPNGERYEGLWENDKLIDGQAVTNLDIGARYEGPVVDGAYTGFGTLTWPSGD